MFLFEGYFGNILHTGDCRLTAECLHYLPEKYVSSKGKKPKCQLDVIFLDCTFGRLSQNFPTTNSAIQQVINCIWKHPDAAVVHLACGSLGQEDILVEVSKAFGSKIFVDQVAMPDIFHSLTLSVPDIITLDHSSRFHLLDAFHRLGEQAAAMLAEAEANFQPAPLIIRPSAQWYAWQEEMKQEERRRRREVGIDEAVKDQIGVWHVCFSRHSSKEELEWALQLLVPGWVVSTTPTSCRAMELDYPTKHCFGKAWNPINRHHQIWKILDLDMDACVSVAEALATEVSYDSVLEHQSPAALPIDVCFTQTKSPLTLFGRPGLHVLESKFLLEEEEKKNNLSSSLKDPPMAAASSFSIISTTCYSESLRKLYRSTNVSVPRPLPSLVALRCETKGAHTKKLI